MIVNSKGGKEMSFDNLLTLLIIGGLGYMMFRGGGCCGSRGGHSKHKDGSEDAGSKTGTGMDDHGSADR